MSLFSDRDTGIKIVTDKVVELADRHSRNMGLSVRVEPNHIIQAYSAAVGTAQFHKIPLPDLSHKKELAHIGFWIAELKPIAILPPVTPATIAENAKLMFSEFLTGAQGAARPFDKQHDAARERYLRHATSPISERIALELIAYFMQVEFRRKLELLPSGTAKKFYLDQNESFQTTLYEDGVFENIVKGLRYHIFTPRSFATLIEAVFAFEGIPPTAQAVRA